MSEDIFSFFINTVDQVIYILELLQGVLLKICLLFAWYYKQ